MRYNSTIICILHLKYPYFMQFGFRMQPPDVKEVTIQPILYCHPTVFFNTLVEKLGDA